MKEARERLGLVQPATYQIKVPGRLDDSWSDWLEGMTVTMECGDDGLTVTTLTGVVADQAALQGVLNKLYSLGIPILSVKIVDPDPEAEEGGEE